MEWLATYWVLIVGVVFILLGWMGIRSAKSMADSKEDPELAKTVKVLGWSGFVVGAFILVYSLIKMVIA